MFLEISQNSQENTCSRVPAGLRYCNFIKKEARAQVFSCHCEISKNLFFTEHVWTTASKLAPYLLIDAVTARDVLANLIASTQLIRVRDVDKKNPLWAIFFLNSISFLCHVISILDLILGNCEIIAVTT